ncbi:MAG: hypothetical protein K0S41_3272 [Anaerocolumna sp.]|jgi:hypothetical protein|nr:hypothetical protein [Anaerocolumna sp.]
MYNLKICWDTKTKNIALEKCIEFIGEHYGNNHKYKNYYISGVKFLSKKVKGATNQSVKNMVYGKRLKNHECFEWSYRTKVYERTYRYIYYILHRNKNKRPLAASLLKNMEDEFYINLHNNLKLSYSDLLVSQPKNMLNNEKANLRNIKKFKYIDSILNEFERVDTVYNYMYRR